MRTLTHDRHKIASCALPDNDHVCRRLFRCPFDGLPARTIQSLKESARKLTPYSVMTCARNDKKTHYGDPNLPKSSSQHGCHHYPEICRQCCHEPPDVCVGSELRIVALGNCQKDHPDRIPKVRIIRDLSRYGSVVTCQDTDRLEFVKIRISCDLSRHGSFVTCQDTDRL